MIILKTIRLRKSDHGQLKKITERPRMSKTVVINVLATNTPAFLVGLRSMPRMNWNKLKDVLEEVKARGVTLSSIRSAKCQVFSFVIVIFYKHVLGKPLLQ